MPMQKMQGPLGGKDQFYVIKFLELPNENATEYVIVPESWIRLFSFGHTSSVREVLVAYPPQESSESTFNRVIAKLRPENEWSAYTGIIEFKADTYSDALAWSMIKNLSLSLMALDNDDSGDIPPVAALESSGSRRNSLSSSNASKLQMQVPAVEIHPSIADEGIRKSQPIKAAAAEYFDDVTALSQMADNYKPIIIETMENTADNSDLSSSEDEFKLIINEEDQNSQTLKKTVNSDDINSPATVPEIPSMSNLSCTLFEPSNAKSPSNFSNQFCSSRLPSLELPTAKNEKHDSLGTQQQMIHQRNTPNSENMKNNNQNLHPQLENKEPSRVPVTNSADQYYVVQFKNVANLQAKYTCVRSCWITATTEYEVKIACPKDLIETQPNMFLLPIILREEWRSYTAVVKYVTVSCNDAKSWIDRETKKNYQAGLPLKRAATSTADEVPTKKRSITFNAAESPLPDLSALLTKANTRFGENYHHPQTSVQEQVPQSYHVPAPQFPPQMQAGYSSLPRFPAQNIYTGFEHQYTPVCGQPNMEVQHIQAYQSSRHQYLPDQQRFSHSYKGQIVANTNIQISTRNMNDYRTSHRPLMVPSNPYNGNYSTMAAPYDSRRGVTGPAGLPHASQDPRLQSRRSGKSVPQHYNNLASRYAPVYPVDQARPIAVDYQPHLEVGAARNIAFHEFKQQRFNAFHKIANECTTHYMGAVHRATTELCPQNGVAWNIMIHEFNQRFEAFHKKVREYNKHYMVAMINATNGLCNDINEYFIR